MVARMAGRLFAAKSRRIAYGAFIRKAWKVASVELELDSIDDLPVELSDRSRWKVVPMPRRYQFLADPFPHPRGGVLVEALKNGEGQGEIVHFENGEARTLCTGTGHFSYPATVQVAGEWFMLPEVSEWSVPKIYRLTDSGAEFAGELDIEGSRHIIDGTLHVQGDTVYLFGNDVSEGSSVLRLWTAPSLFGQFTEHPASPIRISPAGSRMAGNLLQIGNRLYRLGQDGSRGYGKGILAFEVTCLSSSDYAEEHGAEFSFDGVDGPHTFNRLGNIAVFDFYEERFDPLAGLQRVRAHLSKRRALADANS
jgi:hypothetical protein